ncbi:MAG: biotin/lipoate A/B protein ligase family protein [Bacillaceae bacterium]
MATSLLYQDTWRIIDHTSTLLHTTAMQSFAIDDSLCTIVGNGTSPSVARFWVHAPTIVLGIQDTRLPHLQDGISFLREHGYDVIVRNSGGLAVVLDDGILNLSLLFKEQEGTISINEGYDTMYALIKEALKDFHVDIQAYEIKGSYCPGSYDLSIDGKKFAGISQRRIRGGIAVQIYLCVNGSGANRATLIKNFYEQSKKDSPTRYDVPAIEPNVMASLTELLNKELTIVDMQLLLLQALQKHSNHLISNSLQAEEQLLVTHHLERMMKRNEQAGML